MTSFWLSVTSSILFILFWLLPISVTILKGKLWMAALAMLVAPVGWFAAIRVARPGSPWAHLPVPAVAGQTAEGATPRRQVGPSTAADQELDFRAPVRSTCGHHRASVNYGYVCAGHHIPAYRRHGLHLFRAFNIHFTVTGASMCPARGAVLASNHVSYLDFIFCGYAARPSKRLVRFMARKRPSTIRSPDL